MSGGGNHNGRGKNGTQVRITRNGASGLRHLPSVDLARLIWEAHQEYASRFGDGSLHGLLRDTPLVRVDDFALAAYFSTKGLALIGIERNPNPGPNSYQNAMFVFADPNRRADKLKMDFTNSDFSVYDAKTRMFKRVAREMRRQGHRA
jgi:hypothetical protein